MKKILLILALLTLATGCSRPETRIIAMPEGQFARVNDRAGTVEILNRDGEWVSYAEAARTPRSRF